MLKKKIFSIILVIALASSPIMLAGSVSAVGTAISYQDYSDVVSLDSDLNLVTVTLPVDQTLIEFYDWSTRKLLSEAVGSWMRCITTQPTQEVMVSCYPFSSWFSDDDTYKYNGNYLDMRDIPGGADYNVEFLFRYDSYQVQSDVSIPSFYDAVYNDGILTPTRHECQFNEVGEVSYRFIASGKLPVNAEGWVCKFQFNARPVEFEYKPGNFFVFMDSFKISFTVTSLYLLQKETGRTNAILNEVEKQLEANGQKLEDVITSQQQTNEKLDGIQDSLDNQMQNEIDKSQEMGSNASDQVSEAIPDKSAELLPAMQNLAASLSYQGTDAKLPFPKVAMPAIPGVCASYELIPAQEIDFGSYIQMIPSPLLTVIQALCDIAIVIWAFKELYGIYQYVISLKGGGVDV